QRASERVPSTAISQRRPICLKPCGSRSASGPELRFRLQWPRLFQIGVLYRAFDQNENLVRAVMESPAGARGAEEGRASFDQSLKEVMRRRSPAERRQVSAVFHGIHFGPFWQMLRDRGGLSGPEAIAAAS